MIWIGAEGIDVLVLGSGGKGIVLCAVVGYVVSCS